MLGLIGSADVTVPPESHDGSAMLNWRRFRALRPGHCVSRNDWFVAELARGSRVARPAKRLSGAASREQRTSRRLPARLVCYLALLSVFVSLFISLFPLSFIWLDWTSSLVAWFELGSKLARTSSPSLSCSSSATWVPSRVIVTLGAIFTSCSTPAEDKTLSDRLSLSTFLTTPESSLPVSSLLALAVVPVLLGGVWVADDLSAGAGVADDPCSVVEFGSAAFALVTAATNPAAATPMRSFLIVCLLSCGGKR